MEGMVKAFIIPIEELTEKIMRECLESSNPRFNFSDQYVRKVIDNIHKNNSGTKAIIFYNNEKPDSCKKYDDIDWETESQKDEWQSDEGL